MHELDDIMLLREFANNDSQSAFAMLVKRRAGLVYSAALRQVRDPHLAEEVTQAVFIILAQKAGNISDDAHLTGWLFKTTHFASLAEIRASARRQKQAEEFEMQSDLQQPSPDPVWEQMGPLLDEALLKLGEKDRRAVLLRFFENKSLVEVGTYLGTNENTAGRRVTRALEKLRRSFRKNGLVATGVIIGGAISTHSVHAAPSGLVVTTSTTVANGTAAASAATTLVKGTLKLMTYAKIKLAFGIGVGVLLAGGAGTALFSGDSADKTTDPVADGILKRMFERYASLSTYSDNGKSFDGFSTNTFFIRLGRPDLYHLEWDAVGTGSGFSGAAWSAGESHLRYFTGSTWKNNPQRFQRMKGLGDALEGSGNISGGAALTVPPAFFGKAVSDKFGLLGLCSNFLKRHDAKIGDVDCYLLTGHLKAWRNIPISLWIGKEDLLIHQIQRTTLDPDRSIAPPTNSPAFKRLLAKWKKATTRAENVHTEIHENIVINQPLTNADFIFAVPDGMQPFK